MEIEARGPRVRGSINGVLANDADLRSMDRARIPEKDRWLIADLNRTSGRIGLQSFRYPYKFRNIRVKELPPE